jgi:hypothetical protein
MERIPLTTQIMKGISLSTHGVKRISLITHRVKRPKWPNEVVVFKTQRHLLAAMLLAGMTLMEMTAGGTRMTQMLAATTEIALKTSVSRRILHAVFVIVIHAHLATMFLAGMTIMTITASGTLRQIVLAPIMEVAMQTSVTRRILHAVHVVVVA